MKNRAYRVDLQKTSFHNIFSQTLTAWCIFTVLIPNQYNMKKIYFILLLGFSLIVYSQDDALLAHNITTEISGFKLYPNPATADIVYVTTEQNAMKEIRIFDVFGELVLTDRISIKTLDISRLSPGVYMVQVIEKEKSINRKLVVR